MDIKNKKAEEVMLNIFGVQEIDGERDVVELTTGGRYIERDDKIYIEYKDYDTDKQADGISNIVKVEGKKRVTIIQKGGTSRLTFESGQRHQCHYNTGAGAIWLGVFTEQINSNLHDGSGDISVKYTLDCNSDFLSKNEFKIKVKTKGDAKNATCD
ncbi:MAG: DUF1934 domain-containing protein [Oscillospiraceae bacterium]|jgi:uncharacterized beta-barrel protein YwiB (DUF1934 family)|nr:DUF1934 domain-containing protein [Oscillospiraceae bacterium]